MTALLRHPTTVRLAQIVSGIILGWAALAKLGDLPAFAQQVHHFRILPAFAENLIAMTLPWVELMAALSLLLGIRARAGAIVTASLLAIFTLAVIAAVARGLDFECGCFGTSNASRVGLTKVFENLGVLAVALVACMEPRGSEPRRVTPALEADDPRGLSPGA